MKPQLTWSRREFLASVSAAGAGLLLNPFSAWAIDDVNPKVAAIVAAMISIDTHNHIDVPLALAELPGPDADLAGELRRSGLSAICMTFAVDYQRLVNPGDAYQRFVIGLAAMDKVLENNSMKRALNLADLEAAQQKRQPTVIQSVEGGHFLEGKIQRLEEAYKRGLRHFGLLHDSDASVPLGDSYTNAPRWGGLTAFGTAVINECNRLGILIDLAHANAETRATALKASKHPVLISHTGLDTQLGNNPGFSKMMMPRLISKEEAKKVADAGGVIGVWTHLAGTPIEYAQNVRAMVDAIGIDHVCIGTDTKMTPAYKSPSQRGPKPGENDPDQAGRQNYHGAPGMERSDNGANGRRIGEQTNEAWRNQKTGFFYTVVDAMLKTGFSAEEIGKIGGGNYCRVFDAATAGH